MSAAMTLAPYVRCSTANISAPFCSAIFTMCPKTTARGDCAPSPPMYKNTGPVLPDASQNVEFT